MDAHKTEKTQIRRRGGMAPPGAWGKWLQKGKKKKTEPPARGKLGSLKSENDLEGVNFFWEIDPDPGGPLRVGEGSLTRRGEGPLHVGGSGTFAKKPDGFSRV